MELIVKTGFQSSRRMFKHTFPAAEVTLVIFQLRKCKKSPLTFQIDVRVVNFCFTFHFWWFVRVVWANLDVSINSHWIYQKQIKGNSSP